VFHLPRFCSHRLIALVLLVPLAVTACGSAEASDTGGIVLTRDAAIGAQFNAPGPRSCSTRKSPASGKPTPEQARAYVICSLEGTYGSGPQLALVSQVKIEVGRGRPFNILTDSFESIDPTQTVYDIRGSLVSYDCGYAGPNSCKRGDQRDGSGICFRTTFGDWHCTFYDRKNDIVKNPLVKPPTLAEAD
jgi:hypothetical protein